MHTEYCNSTLCHFAQKSFTKQKVLKSLIQEKHKEEKGKLSLAVWNVQCGRGAFNCFHIVTWTSYILIADCCSVHFYQTLWLYKKGAFNLFILDVLHVNNVGNWSRLLNSHVLPPTIFKSCCPGSPRPTLEMNWSMTDCHSFRWTRTIVAVFIVLWYFCSVCLGGPYEKLLLDALMKNYNTQNRSHLQKKKYLNHSIFHY